MAPRSVRHGPSPWESWLAPSGSRIQNHPATAGSGSPRRSKRGLFGGNRVKKISDLSAVTRSYDLSLWLLQRTGGFSRAHRHTLGTRIEEASLEVLELLIEAGYSREKIPPLERANRRIERLRYLIRLAHDLKLLAPNQYVFASEALFVLGSEVGSWRKSIERRTGPSSPEPLEKTLEEE